MKKIFGKNEASHNGNKNSVIMIVSIIAVSLFIGTAMQPALASPISDKEINSETDPDNCSLCRPRSKDAGPGPSCKTCLCAVGIAVTHSLKYAKDKINYKINENNGEVIDGILGDIVLWLLEGTAEGIKKSGFKIDIDYNELKDVIKNLVNEGIGPQGHDITKILVTLRYISIGIRIYLVSLCINGKQYFPISAAIIRFLSETIPIFLLKILAQVV
jgi:hypothetical protein